MYPGKSVKTRFLVLENSGIWSLQVLEYSVLMSIQTLPNAADWSGGMPASCTTGPIIHYHGQWMAT